MADLPERISAELENIDGVLARIPSDKVLPDLSELELAGVAALVHSFYNGVENVLKQVLQSRGIALPTGESWHKELILIAAESGVLSEETSHGIRDYLAFRHFFTHAYAFDLDPERLEPLVAKLADVNGAFRRDLSRAVQSTD
ncbi:MAG: hypothetical protein QGH15_11560 [Kiritimatiellia bacterium]|jgi:hypothetical protein|nr:hypothetical protein [Kiritimatiellia bacterium]